MTKRERILAAIKREPTDRPPYAFWRHFPNVDRSPAALAQTTLRFHERYGSGFLKGTPPRWLCGRGLGLRRERGAGTGRPPPLPAPCGERSRGLEEDPPRRHGVHGLGVPHRVRHPLRGGPPRGLLGRPDGVQPAVAGAQALRPTARLRPQGEHAPPRGRAPRHHRDDPPPL